MPRLERRALLCLLAASVLTVAAGCGGGDEPRPQAGLFGYRSDAPLEPEAEDVAEWPGAGAVAAKTQAIRYAGSKERVPGLFALPQNADGVPCVLFLHGFGNDKEGAWPLVGPLTGSGIGLLAIDEAGQASRAESPEAVKAVLRDPQRYAQLLRETSVDARRGLDYLQTRSECDPERLGVMGFSFGALAAAPLAAEDQRVRSTVLISIGAGWKAELTSSLGFGLSPKADRATYDAGLEALDPLAPERWIGRIAPRPVLLVNGRQDEAFGPRVQRELADAGGANSERITYEGGHNFFKAADPQRLGEQVGDFLNRTLVEAQPGEGA